MDGSSKQEAGNKKVTKVTTFLVPYEIGKIKENILISTNTHAKPSRAQIINQAIEFHLKGNIPEATKFYQYCINQGFIH